MFIADHGLLQFAATFNDIHDVVHDAIFKTHDDIKITQTNIAIYADDLFAVHCESVGKVCHGCGLTHAAFS